MKGVKINVKKTLVDFKEPFYKEVSYDKSVLMSSQDGSVVPNETTFKEDIYFPMKVYEPGAFEHTIYLVKQDEKGVFIDLMNITRETIHRAIDNAVDKKWELEHQAIESRVKTGIKNLPWHKRLFKKF